jgi:hypothetical protein
VVARLLPIVRWLPTYDRALLRGDVAAGIAVTAPIVPKDLGYAGIAGVPLQNGLYAAAGALVYALFGTSRQISTGPSSSLAAVAATADALHDRLRRITHDSDPPVSAVVLDLEGVDSSTPRDPRSWPSSPSSPTSTESRCASRASRSRSSPSSRPTASSNGSAPTTCTTGSRGHHRRVGSPRRLTRRVGGRQALGAALCGDRLGGGDALAALVAKASSSR